MKAQGSLTYLLLLGSGLIVAAIVVSLVIGTAAGAKNIGTDAHCKYLIEIGKTMPRGENCTDGKDNDCDSLIDCADADCIGDTACPGTGCTDDCIGDGTLECQGNAYHICGEYDLDACLDWSSLTACETGETCENGICQPTGDCTSNTQCDDSNPCTVDSCDLGTCNNNPIANGTPCTGGTCQNGTCTPTIPSCTSDSQCTQYSEYCETENCLTCSNPMQNCITDNGTGCETNIQTNTEHCGLCENNCTPGQTCSNGTCENPPLFCLFVSDCDDSNPCTTEACNFFSCQYTNEPYGTPCTGGFCDDSSGTCIIAPITCNNNPECDDSKECTTDTCLNPGIYTSSCQNTNITNGTPCTGGTCQDGTCTPTCTNECSPEYTKTCIGDSWKQCGEYDTDDCLEWSSLTDCSPQNCISGECVASCSDECASTGLRDCQGNAYHICGDYDSDSCLEWNTLTNCGTEENCVNGYCKTTCADECTSPGEKACEGNAWKQCGDYDSDDCLDWSNLTSCGTGKYCETGECKDLESADLYADSSLSTNCTGNYSVVNRNCSGSNGTAYMKIQDALNSADSGDTIAVREGIYRESITFPKSGTAANPITLKGYTGEEPVITGSDSVRLTKSGSYPNIYYTNISAEGPQELPTQVFKGNTELSQSVYTSNSLENGFYFPTSVPSGSQTTFTDTANLSETNNYFKGALLHMRVTPYTIETRKIASSTSGGQIVLANGLYAPINSYSDGTSSGYFITNVIQFSEINNNEWAYDTSADTLYMRLNESGNQSANEYEVSVRDNVIEISGRTGIVIDGLTIRNGNSNNITVKSSNDITLQNNIIENANQFGIYLSEPSNRRVKIIGNTIKNIGVRGIYARYAYDTTIEYNKILRTGKVQSKCEIPMLYNTTGSATSQAIHIITGLNGLSIKYNEIDGAQAHGISLLDFSDSVIGGREIAYNIIRNTSVFSLDEGAIYRNPLSDNPSRTADLIHHNIIENVPGCENGQYYHSRTDSIGQAYGIYLDEALEVSDTDITDVKIYKNTVSNALSGGMIHYQNKTLWEDNIFFNNNGTGIISSNFGGGTEKAPYTNKDNTFQRNTFTSKTSSTDNFKDYRRSQNLDSFGSMNNNLYFIPSSNKSFEYKAGSVVTTYNLSEWKARGYDSGSQELIAKNPSLQTNSGNNPISVTVASGKCASDGTTGPATITIESYESVVIYTC